MDLIHSQFKLNWFSISFQFQIKFHLIFKLTTLSIISILHLLFIINYIHILLLTQNYTFYLANIFLLFHKHLIKIPEFKQISKFQYHLRIQLYPKFFGKFNYPFEFQNQTQFTNNSNVKQFGSNFSSRNSKMNIDDAAVITDVIFQWPKEFNALISLKTLPNIFDFKSPKFQTQKYFWNNTITSPKPLETTFKSKGILNFPKNSKFPIHPIHI